MEFLKDLLGKLSAPYSERVGVYVSSDSMMEVVVYDKEMGNVKKSEKVEIKYDNVTRQVDPEEFEASLVYLVNKMEIPTNYPFFVSLPNILTSVKTMPSDLEDIELEIAFNSEAEKSYIFKKTDPQSSWNLIATNEHDLTNSYVYSVIQKEQVKKFEEFFKRNNLKLHAIDTSFASLIRGLAISGILRDNLENNLKWAIVTISHISYITAKFQGKKLINIIETPIALKSIESDVLYSTIGNAVTEKLGHDGLDNIYIVSQTSDFVAEHFVSNIKTICNIHTIDNNTFNNQPMFLSPTSEALESISPESVGTACWNNAPIDINFNFCEDDNKSEVQGILGNIGITRVLHLYLFVALIISGIIIAVASFTFLGINNYLESEIRKKQLEIGNLQKLDVKTPKEFDLGKIILKSYKKNLEVINSYDSIGATIPEKVWLQSFFIDNNLNTMIKGISYSVEDIIIYFENLQKVSAFRNLKIKTIKIASSGEDSSGEDEKTYGGKDLSLPPPPVPNQEEQQAGVLNYYEFIFQDIDEKDKNNSFMNNIPASVRRIFGN